MPRRRNHRVYDATASVNNGDNENVSVGSNDDESTDEALSKDDFNRVFEETRIVDDERRSKHVNKKYGTSDSTVFSSDSCELDDCLRDPTLSTEPAPVEGRNEAGDIGRAPAAAAGKCVEVFTGSKRDESANGRSNRVSHSLCCGCGCYNNETTGKRVSWTLCSELNCHELSFAA
jgi:hypothetical protein